MPTNVIAPVLYIGGITWTAPRIGLGNAVLIVLVGQLVSAALIDHFGLAGAIAAPLTFQRVTGLSLVVIGALLARKDLAGP